MPSTTQPEPTIDFSRFEPDYISALAYTTCLKIIWEAFSLVDFAQHVRYFPRKRQTIDFPGEARLELHKFDNNIISNFSEPEIKKIITWASETEEGYKLVGGSVLDYDIMIQCLKSSRYPSYNTDLIRYETIFDKIATDFMKIHNLMER